MIGWLLMAVGAAMILYVMIGAWRAERMAPARCSTKPQPYPHGTYCGLVCEGGSEARACKCEGPWQCTEGNFIPAHMVPKKRKARK